jgi:hypothetical protein
VCFKERDRDELTDELFADTNEFPGSMPVTFSRRHFAIVQSNPYFVSEKTDGIRYLMLIVREGVFLIDRKYSFKRLENFNLLIELYATEGFHKI